MKTQISDDTACSYNFSEIILIPSIENFDSATWIPPKEMEYSSILPQILTAAAYLCRHSLIRVTYQFTSRAMKKLSFNFQ